MPDPQVNQQPKAQDVLSNILQGKLNDLQSITPWIVQSAKLNNKILRTLVLSLREQEGWDDARILEIILFFDEAAEKNCITNEFLKDLKENPGKLEDLKQIVNESK
jgi:hypothetical protein